MYNFALILTLFGHDAPDSKYAIDTRMTGEDCIAAMQYQQDLLVRTFDKFDFELSCVFDFAPNMYED